MRIVCSQPSVAGPNSPSSSVISSRRRLIAWTLAAPACLCCPPPPPALAATVKPAAPPQWAYTNDDSSLNNWPKSCTSGKQQSPIDIPPSPATGEAPPLRPRYPRFVKEGATVVNNGHGSPQVNFPPGFELEIGDRRYTLLQLHFHAPSEHRLLNQHAAIECHLVHRDVVTRELAVVAILMKSGLPNQVLQTALESAPSSASSSSGGGPTVVKNELCRAISLLSILPPPQTRAGGRRYATYVGSLTTPPCTEKVKWFVLLDEVQVGPQQILDLMAFESDGETWSLTDRPIQPLNNRKVEYSL